MGGFDPTFVGAGAAHRGGSVPDPGSSSGTTRTLYENAEWREPLETNSPLLVAYPSSIVALCLNLSVSSGPDFAGSPPTDWTTLAFDDSGWAEAVVYGTAYIAGTDKIWFNTSATAYAESLFRHHFSIPTGAMVSKAQIQIEVDSAYYGIWVNGTLLEGAQILAMTDPSAGATYPIPPALLKLDGADNVVTIWVKNNSDTTGAGVDYKLDFYGIGQNTGPAGSTGPSGPSGAVGATGATGPAGSGGGTGGVGATGASGPTGLTGAPGSLGATGASGPEGATGAVGLTGSVGAAGPRGASGPAGASGPVGATGAGGVGSLGPTGATGPRGATGAVGGGGGAGATGATGPGGSGSIGATGPIGSTGPAGATGPRGATGASGGGSVFSYTDAALSIAVTLTTAQTVLETELLDAGDYFVSGAANFGAASTDTFVSLALVTGSTSFAAGSAHLHSGETVSIGLPVRHIFLGSAATIKLVGTSVGTAATVSPSNSEGQGKATYITAMRFD